MSRSAAGADLPGSALALRRTRRSRLCHTVAEALDGVDVLIDYTSGEGNKANTLTAISRGGVAVVIGASGPTTADDYAEIDAAARKHGVGVVSAGNYWVYAAAMRQAAAVLVARHLPRPELIDYASDTKADVPERNLARARRRLDRRGASGRGRADPVDQIDGPPEARGAGWWQEPRSTRSHLRASGVFRPR